MCDLCGKGAEQGELLKAIEQPTSRYKGDIGDPHVIYAHATCISTHKIKGTMRITCKKRRTPRATIELTDRSWGQFDNKPFGLNF